MSNLEEILAEKVQKINEKLELTHIIQPNAVTAARYDYTSMQKNILYETIGQLQEKMTKNKLNKDLFGSIYVNVPISFIAGNKNHQKVYEAAEDLIDKKFQYNWKNKKGNDVRTTTALVASVSHEKNSKYITLNIPEEIVPVLLYIGEGFTKLQKVIAITLKSVYAKQMYEHCNRWKDLGGFTMPLDEYKQMMCIEDKYEKLSMLKTRVLNVAQKELKEKAEIYFEYKLYKKDSRQFNYITFKILENDINPEVEGSATEKQKMLILNMLDIPYPMVKNSKAIDLSKTIEEHAEFDKIYSRIYVLRKELKDGKKTPKDIEHLLPFILKEDFGIE